MNNITLNDFLMLFTHKNTSMAIFSHINTNNNSFPEKYRRSFEHVASFWVELNYKTKSEDAKKLLNRKIESALLLPVDFDVDGILIF